MQKYFVYYKYLIGYADGSGDRIYETSSAIIELDINLIGDIYDICEIIYQQELSCITYKKFSKFDIDIINFNKV